MVSFWMAILLLLKEKYRVIWYRKSTLTSSAEKIALASEETKKGKGVGLELNPKNTAKHPSCFMKATGGLWISPWAGGAPAP